MERILQVEFTDFSVTCHYDTRRGRQSFTRYTSKPLPIHAFGDIGAGSDVEHVIIYNDARHADEGPYQAVLFLLRDFRRMPVTFFVNEKGHGSGYHGTWRALKCVGQSVHNNVVCSSQLNISYFIKFDCMGTRGPGRNIILEGRVPYPPESEESPEQVFYVALCAQNIEHRRHVTGNTIAII